MINSKYSLNNFIDTSVSDAKILSAELEKSVLNRIHNVVDKEFELVINELNSMGHSLSLRNVKKPGDIGFIEKDRLRLDVDVIVSSGYDDLINM